MVNDNCTILIVDNEIEICNLLKDFFDFIGHESCYETDGRRVLADLESWSYDLMLVDLRLDEVSGIEILKKSKECHPLSEVIVITGYGSEETIRETYRHGAFAYIQKPISFSEIKVQTEEALARMKFNRKTAAIHKLLATADPALSKHFEDIVQLDRLAELLNLTIDIETLSESILAGIADLIPGHYCSFMFFDDINKEMAILSPEMVGEDTIDNIQARVKAHFEKMANVDVGDSYHLRVVLPQAGPAPVRASAVMLEDVFVPILIENTIHGMLGVSREKIENNEYIQDILRIVATRISDVLTNATLHRNTKLLALTDGLTGLLNRSALHERLEGEYQRFKRYGSHLSLIVADLDNLKEINDSYGHPVGDEVIRKIGDILRETTRESDVLTRYGGDEFVIVLPQTNAQNAMNLAERIRIKIKEYPFKVNEKRFSCTISLGVATAPGKDIDSAENLLEAADQAMYGSKRSGRNQVSAMTG